MRLAFVVRFKKNGKVGNFKTSARSPKEAAQKCRNGRILSVRKTTAKAR